MSDYALIVDRLTPEKANPGSIIEIGVILEAYALPYQYAETKIHVTEIDTGIEKQSSWYKIQDEHKLGIALRFEVDESLSEGDIISYKIDVYERDPLVDDITDTTTHDVLITEYPITPDIMQFADSPMVGLAAGVIGYLIGDDMKTAVEWGASATALHFAYKYLTKIDVMVE